MIVRRSFHGALRLVRDDDQFVRLPIAPAAGSVDAGAGGVGAAGGEGPAEDARLGLLDHPAGGLFRAMVRAALGA